MGPSLGSSCLSSYAIYYLCITFGLAFTNVSFLKMGQSRSLFVYFRSFLIIISIQIEKSIDGVLGIRTRGCNMVGADETTELWLTNVSS